MINGYGLGLRTDHYAEFVEQKPQLDWLEIISENYLVPGGKPLHFLDRIRADYPMVMHGVSLSIGSVDPLDFVYLKQIKSLAQRVEPGWISDHLCWTGVDHTNLHDLLPLPYTEETLRHLTRRISRVQEFLGRRILLENVSSYVLCAQDEMSEWEFVSELAARADCFLLLDVNNVYVSARNHGFNPHDYIDALPGNRVRQIHLAGHQDNGELVIDTHDHPIRDEVYELYAHTLRKLGPIPTMIERDDHIPPLQELLAELEQVRQTAAAAIGLARKMEVA
ncbi:MAG: DUF692 domain-containing protein [Gammaproteobacteria bacterium]|nr:DUF692 domain-containing protein [Gammaproteobacteria bacterium]MCP5442337.1 DUF692 domain-containing protein [Chromatiaceae bacterium]